MVTVVLRNHDAAEDARRRGALAGAIVLPMLAHTRAEAEYVRDYIAHPNHPAGPLLLVTSVAHAYRALATFAKVMPRRRIYVAALAGDGPDDIERRKWVECAAKGDIMTEAEMESYLAWRDG